MKTHAVIIVAALALGGHACSSLEPLEEPPVVDDSGCTEYESSAEGTLRGTEVSACWPGGAATFGERSTTWGLGTRGDVHLSVAGPTLFEAGVAVAAVGFARLPLESPFPLEIFCAGEGTTYTRAAGEARQIASFAALASAGVCPGTPVEGSIHFRTTSGEPDEIATMQLEGTPASWAMQSAASFGEARYVRTFDNGAVLSVDIVEGEVVGCFLGIPGEDDGVFCIDEGTYVIEDDDPNDLGFTADLQITAISRLDPCGTPEGELVILH